MFTYFFYLQNSPSIENDLSSEHDPSSFDKLFILKFRSLFTFLTYGQHVRLLWSIKFKCENKQRLGRKRNNRYKSYLSVYSTFTEETRGDWDRIRLDERG